MIASAKKRILQTQWALCTKRYQTEGGDMQRAIDLLKAAALDIDRYLDNPQAYEPEYFESVQDAILNAIDLMEKQV
jgi:Cdc6-like AAA superfamily ATPase